MKIKPTTTAHTGKRHSVSSARNGSSVARAKRYLGKKGKSREESSSMPTVKRSSHGTDAYKKGAHSRQLQKRERGEKSKNEREKKTLLCVRESLQHRGKRKKGRASLHKEE